jgi:hypothetical protein
MTDLSPAAQAVRSAALYAGPKLEGRIAAALRALAIRINGADAIRQDILDIAAEMDAQ